jgi:polysaccharide chain length determinant protein (PEP-CTERM system associated)
MKKRLEEVEQNLKEYRIKYMGELPEQLETNLRVLDRLQIEMNDKQQRLSELKHGLIGFENQMLDRGVLLTSNGIAEFEIESSTNLEQLKKELAGLKTRYTDWHPDVIRLTGKIAALEGKNKKGSEGTVGESSDSGASINRTGSNIKSIGQREAIRREIRSLEKEISELNRRSKIYQARVENTPKREQELMSLRRDYQNIQSSYNSLLNRKLEAEIAVNMELKQKGEQFQIIDFASLPEKPVKPNMKLLFVLSVAVGLGFGCGVVYLLYYLDTSIRCHEDIESFLGIPVLATCPIIYHPKDIRKEKINQFLLCYILL